MYTSRCRNIALCDRLFKIERQNVYLGMLLFVLFTDEGPKSVVPRLARSRSAASDPAEWNLYPNISKPRLRAVHDATSMAATCQKAIFLSESKDRF